MSIEEDSEDDCKRSALTGKEKKVIGCERDWQILHTFHHDLFTVSNWLVDNKVK